MSSPCLLVTLFAKRTFGVCADLAAEAIPAFTDAGEFGAGEFTPGKQAGKHQIKECRLVVQGTRGNAEHLHPLLRAPTLTTADRSRARAWIDVLERLNFDMDLERELVGPSTLVSTEVAT